MKLSDEERERRRQNILALKEEGRVGPQFGKLGGRPPKPRASEIIAEEVSSNANEMLRRLLEIVSEGKDGPSIKAVETLLRIEENERKIQVEEVQNFEKAKRDELLAIVAGGLRELQDAGISIDGWAVEITDEEFEGIGEGDGGTPQTE